MDGSFTYCDVCKRELHEQYFMARKKQPEKPTAANPAMEEIAAKEQLKAKNPDMVAGAALAADAAKVMEAAKPLFPSNLSVPMDWEPMTAEDRISRDWERRQRDVSAMDDEFRNQYMNNFDNLDVKVMQVSPDGRLTDVTGRINPRDLDESQIEKFEFQTPSSLVPRLPNGEVDRKRAMQMLSDLITNGGGLRVPGRGGRGLGEYISPAQQKLMKEMEATLAESDKILKHWKE
jgi:hypothetical protein